MNLALLQNLVIVLVFQLPFQKMEFWGKIYYIVAFLSEEKATIKPFSGRNATIGKGFLQHANQYFFIFLSFSHFLYEFRIMCSYFLSEIISRKRQKSEKVDKKKGRF